VNHRAYHLPLPFSKRDRDSHHKFFERYYVEIQAIQIAAYRGHINVTEYILSKNSQIMNASLSMKAAVTGGHLELIKFLETILDDQLQVDSQTLLYSAIFHDNAEMVEHLISSRTFSFSDLAGAIQRATLHDLPGIYDVIRRAGEKLGEFDWRGFNPNGPKVLALVWSYINQQTRIHALEYGIKIANLQIVRFCLDQGAIVVKAEADRIMNAIARARRDYVGTGPVGNFDYSSSAMVSLILDHPSIQGWLDLENLIAHVNNIYNQPEPGGFRVIRLLKKKIRELNVGTESS
jgi:hypothetical protein